jgi:hypothetical protein
VSRAVVRLILDVALTITLAWALLGLWQWFLVGSPADGFGEAARVLFNFVDVGLAAWVLLLIVFLVRRRPVGVSAGRVLLLLALGAILNLLVVAVVGFVQGGGAPLLVLFAIEAGLACLIAAAIVVPIAHRVLRVAPAVDNTAAPGATP